MNFRISLRPEDPLEKAAEQLREARISFLEVSAHVEYYVAMRDALEIRIQRLENYIANEATKDLP